MTKHELYAALYINMNELIFGCHPTSNNNYWALPVSSVLHNRRISEMKNYGNPPSITNNENIIIMFESLFY